MVKGLMKFKEYFNDYSDSYVLIGGAACDILFSESGSDFRATRDLDMVLIVEALDSNFARKFWKFVKEGKYRHISGSTGKPQFYRFDKPQTEGFPQMIELFSKDNFKLKEDIGITPIHIDGDISSLSAILLNDDYYQILLDGRVVENGYSVLKPEYLILFKAKAYLDLIARKMNGESIDSSDIKKHKKDVLRLTVEMLLNPIPELPKTVSNDIHQFISSLKENPFDNNSLERYRIDTNRVIDRLKEIFG